MQSPVIGEIAKRTSTSVEAGPVPAGRSRTGEIVAVGPTAGHAERAVLLMQAAVNHWLTLHGASEQEEEEHEDEAGEESRGGRFSGWRRRLVTKAKETSKKMMKRS